MLVQVLILLQLNIKKKKRLRLLLSLKKTLVRGLLFVLLQKLLLGLAK